MHVAREILTSQDEDGEGIRVDHVSASVSIAKTMRPADEPTNREMRRRRDLIYLLLKREGLSSREISRTCKFAARSPSQIRDRIIAASEYYGRAHCG